MDGIHKTTEEHNPKAKMKSIDQVYDIIADMLRNKKVIQ